jgi:hypothetical protein
MQFIWQMYVLDFDCGGQYKRRSFLTNSDVFSCAQQANDISVGLTVWARMYAGGLTRACTLFLLIFILSHQIFKNEIRS